VGYPVPFTATATSTNCTLSYWWSFGDGFTATTLNATHIYAAAGTYTWYFAATDVGGNWCYQQGVITIGPCTLTCGTATVPLTGATGQAITFSTTDATASATCSGTISYTWNFGDGATGTGLTATHTYTTPGAYPWTMTAQVDAMTTCVLSGTITIALGCAITCTATVPASGIATIAVPFAATATPNAACVGAPAFAWAFGDGGVAAGENVTHAYASGGTFTWTLTVTIGTTVCTQTGTITITGTTITCSASVPATVLVETPVNFVGSANVTACVGTPIYAWTFGDGGTSSLLSPTHTYTVPGTYTWTFTVTCGSETCTRTGLINVCQLACSAAAQPTQGFAPLTVNFAALMQPGCAGNITYDWNFGDGTAHSSLYQISHTYTVPGTYIWTMTAMVNGLACTETGTISVCALTCTASAPTAGAAGVPVSFTSTSMISYCRGTPEYTWYFGDGGTSFLQSPTHTYVNGGTYVWSLTVREAGGTCTQTGTIVISNPPIVTQMKAKDQPEFNIIVKGRNIQPGVAVYINGVQWYSTTWKSTYKLRINGGTALKAVAPPNIPLQFTFVNPDGATWTVIWQYPL
jgi:PKD repeat protein